jgi:hypothetical protein
MTQFLGLLSWVLVVVTITDHNGIVVEILDAGATGMARAECDLCWLASLTLIYLPTDMQFPRHAISSLVSVSNDATAS